MSATGVESRDEFMNQHEHYHPDVILSDHGLPSFDGFTALAIAKDKYPDIPFIFVTNSLGEEIAIETFENGATDYVLKNNLTKLAPAVKRALRCSAERMQLRQQGQRVRGSEERLRGGGEGGG